MTGSVAAATISIYYDSMLAKIIAWGGDRAERRSPGSANALDVDGTSKGSATNLPLPRPRDRSRSQTFRCRRTTTTAYLDDHADLLQGAPKPIRIACGLPAGASAAVRLTDPRSWRIGGVGDSDRTALEVPQRRLSVVASRRRRRELVAAR